MLIVALKPIKLRLDDGDQVLTPGQPVDLPDDQARLLLAKAQGKVRLVRESVGGPEGACGLACHGCGRSSPTLYRLASCWRCASCVAPGARIWWETPRGTRGPALVSELVLNSDGVWCWAENADFHGWVLARVITRLEPGVGKV